MSTAWTLAKQQGAPRYFSGKTCPRGHTCERYTSDTQCVLCRKAKSAALDRGPVRARSREYMHIHRGDRSSYHKLWISNNGDKIRASARRHYERTKDATRERRKILAKVQNDKNSINGVRAFYSQKFRSDLNNRTPSWLSTEENERMKVIYQISANLSKIDNLPYEVDHIVPLRGKRVSGLHVPENLRIVLKTVNRSKGNRFKS